MSNPPMWGNEAAEPSDLPERGSEAEAPETARGEARQVRQPRSRHAAGRQQAVDDAQQSLHSLLNKPASDGQPHVISQSGATRSAKSRVAGPTQDHPRLSSDTRPQGRARLSSGTASPGSSLAVRGSGLPVAVPETRTPPRGRLGVQVARASSSLLDARDRANLLLGDPSNIAGLDVATDQASRRSASQWATRYATHLVILVVIGVLVGLGGLKSFTAQSAYLHSLSSIEALSGAGIIEDDDGPTNGRADTDAQDFSLALPRTELNTSSPAGQPNAQPDAAKNTRTAAETSQNKAQASGSVVPYTVAQGDTIESVADKFSLMPETVMGSNGIFDSEEILASGRVLMIPPIDGMYYVAHKGDTVDSVANRFQADPAAISAYKLNNVADGATLNEGQAILVPGGMIPARETTVTYTVRRGDSLKGIAARFGVDVPTMVNSNSIPDPDNLQPGSQLRVLPVPGIEYRIKRGDNIKTVADKFGVSPQMILDYQPNHLTVASTLRIDQVIMVPGGDPENAGSVVAAVRIQPDARSDVRPQDGGSPKGDGGNVKPKPATNTDPGTTSGTNSKPPPGSKPGSGDDEKPTATPKPKNSPTPKPTPKGDTGKGDNSVQVGTGHLMWPVNGTITQYFSARHNGLDIAISAGTPIHAADSGKVIWAGWRTDGLGYCVMIDHLNGLVTVYGHMIRQPSVYVGQYVSRGQVIGNIGSTGHSTGPHVHFMVKNGGNHNYRNPLSYLGG